MFLSAKKKGQKMSDESRRAAELPKPTREAKKTGGRRMLEPLGLRAANKGDGKGKKHINQSNV